MYYKKAVFRDAKDGLLQNVWFYFVLTLVVFLFKSNGKTASPLCFLIAVKPESVIRICTDYVLMSSRLPTVSSKA